MQDLFCLEPVLVLVLNPGGVPFLMDCTWSLYGARRAAILHSPSGPRGLDTMTEWDPSVVFTVSKNQNDMDQCQAELARRCGPSTSTHERVSRGSATADPGCHLFW